MDEFDPGLTVIVPLVDGKVIVPLVKLTTFPLIMGSTLLIEVLGFTRVPVPTETTKLGVG
jgi:hypothetical protein